MSNQKKVIVNIRCKQVICYRQQKEMTMQEFQSLKECDGDEVHETRNSNQYSLLQDYINPSDVFDAHNEYLDFEISLEQGKKKKK